MCLRDYFSSYTRPREFARGNVSTRGTAAFINIVYARTRTPGPGPENMSIKLINLFSARRRRRLVKTRCVVTRDNRLKNNPEKYRARYAYHCLLS